MIFELRKELVVVIAEDEQEEELLLELLVDRPVDELQRLLSAATAAKEVLHLLTLYLSILFDYRCIEHLFKVVYNLLELVVVHV